MATTAIAGGDIQRELTTGGIWKGAFLGAAAGAVANVILYFATSAAGASMLGEFQKGAPAVPMPFAPVVIGSFVPAIFAALAAMLVNRLTASASKVYVIVAVVVALLSMGGPLNLGGAGGGLKLALALMHVASAVTITGGILRFGKR
jgi:hypothetical protein